MRYDNMSSQAVTVRAQQVRADALVDIILATYGWLERAANRVFGALRAPKRWQHAVNVGAQTARL